MIVCHWSLVFITTYILLCNVFIIRIKQLNILFQVYKVGEHILARWSDCKMYPAKIIAANDNGKQNKFDSNRNVFQL